MKPDDPQEMPPRDDDWQAQAEQDPAYIERLDRFNNQEEMKYGNRSYG